MEPTGIKPQTLGMVSIHAITKPPGLHLLARVIKTHQNEEGVKIRLKTLCEDCRWIEEPQQRKDSDRSKGISDVQHAH